MTVRLNLKISTRKFILASAITVGLFAAIVLAIMLPILNGGSNIPSSSPLPSSIRSTVSAQEENSIVPLDKIVDGGPPRDGIPSIDNPKFTSVQKAEEIIEGL